MTDEDLIATVELGEEARNFLEGDVGKSLLAAAEQDALNSLERLGATDPGDTKEIMRWQIELKAARKVKDKLVQLIGLGDNALAVWNDRNGANYES